MEQPELFWVPSVTASGIAFYTGDKIPAWKGNLFLGSMTVGRISGTGNLQRVVFNENGEQRRESLLADLHQRIRDVRQGPDGFLYLLTDENNAALLRIEPAP
jgi:glucose/arabinose dehydrogenase